MRIRFTPQAVNDVEDAVTYYDGIAPDLGEQFLDQLDGVIDRLQVFPSGAPPVDGFRAIRRARRRQFPYGVFYRIDDEELVVLRVLHERRGSSAR